LEGGLHEVPSVSERMKKVPALTPCSPHWW
jgi:hypothetical protein